MSELMPGNEPSLLDTPDSATRGRRRPGQRRRPRAILAHLADDARSVIIDEANVDATRAIATAFPGTGCLSAGFVEVTPRRDGWHSLLYLGMQPVRDNWHQDSRALATGRVGGHSGNLGGSPSGWDKCLGARRTCLRDFHPLCCDARLLPGIDAWPGEGGPELSALWLGLHYHAVILRRQDAVTAGERPSRA